MLDENVSMCWRLPCDGSCFLVWIQSSCSSGWPQVHWIAEAGLALLILLPPPPLYWDCTTCLFFLLLCMCAYSFGCTCVCVHMFLEIRGQHWESFLHSSGVPSIFFLYLLIFFYLAWSSPTRLSWLGSKPEGSACLCLSIARVTGVRSKVAPKWQWWWHCPTEGLLPGKQV